MFIEEGSWWPVHYRSFPPSLIALRTLSHIENEQRAFRLLEVWILVGFERSYDVIKIKIELGTSFNLAKPNLTGSFPFALLRRWSSSIL